MKRHVPVPSLSLALRNDIYRDLHLFIRIAPSLRNVPEDIPVSHSSATSWNKFLDYFKVGTIYLAATIAMGGKIYFSFRAQKNVNKHGIHLERLLHSVSKRNSREHVSMLSNFYLKCTARAESLSFVRDVEKKNKLLSSNSQRVVKRWYKFVRTDRKSPVEIDYIA